MRELIFRRGRSDRGMLMKLKRVALYGLAALIFSSFGVLAPPPNRLNVQLTLYRDCIYEESTEHIFTQSTEHAAAS